MRGSLGQGTVPRKALAGEDATMARERVQLPIDAVRVVPSPADPKAAPRIEIGHRLGEDMPRAARVEAVEPPNLDGQHSLRGGDRPGGGG